MPDLLSTFKDSWTTPGLSLCWTVFPAYAQGHGTYGAASLGEGVVVGYDGTQGPGGPGARISTTDSTWLFTDDTCSVYVADLPAGVAASLLVNAVAVGGAGGGACHVQILRLEDGTLEWEVNTDLGFSGATIPDNGERYWRARHNSSVTTLYAETSPDGVTWTTLGAQAHGGSGGLNAASARLTTSSGSARFEQWNGGGVPCCPTAPCVARQRAWASLL